MFGVSPLVGLVNVDMWKDWSHKPTALPLGVLACLCDIFISFIYFETPYVRITSDFEDTLTHMRTHTTTID